MLWSGRFARGPHPEMVALTASISFDVELLAHDLAVTRAHARVLEAAGHMSTEDVAAIDDATRSLLEAFASGSVAPSAADEDVHSFVERVLTEELGEVGKRIHAGRSRNDLVATDLRLWARDGAGEAVDALIGLISVISDFGEGQAETVMPGYTHMQRGQPVSFGFHMLAHGFALLRDAHRFRAAFEAANASALGAGAVAGNTLDLDPQVAADELAFDRTFDNAMDAVSDRDFAVDLLYASALCGVHLSRLGEEIVLWTSPEFGFARLADEWSTGSSMMPQKRNPDLAELIRGRSAGGIADLTGILTLIKGTPLAYNRDLQEDKLFLFRSIERIVGSIRGMTSLLGALRLDKERMSAAASGSATWATDLAERLVARGAPFRDAHEAVGALVGHLEETGADLAGIAQELPKHHPLLSPDDAEVSDPLIGLRARRSPGGTAPERVLEQVRDLRAKAAALSGVRSA